MQRVRRLVPLALAVVLGVTGLTGCRSNPAVAAYVGGRQYTVQDINDMIDEVVELTPEEQQQGQIDLGEVRRGAIQLLVIGDLLARIEADRGVRVQETDPETVAQMLNLDPSAARTAKLVRTEYVTTMVRMRVAIDEVAQVVTPADPTEADQREVFTSLADQGQLPGRTFDDIRPSLTRELLGRHLGLRNALLDAMHRYHVVVNPRYAPVAFPVEIRLGEQVSAYVQLPLVER